MSDPSRKLGFAIVGCGVVSQQHAAALASLPNAELVAVVDEDAARAQKAGTEYGVDWSQDLGATLERPDVDVVCVCVPSNLHATMGIPAAEAGKHVLMEKPIDISLGAADALLESCRKANVQLGVVSQHRFRPGFAPAKKIIDSGQLGKLVLADVHMKYYRTQEYYDSGAWRGKWATDGGGCLMNQGVHYVDIFHWLLGDVARITAKCVTRAHTIEVEDVATAILEFQSGAIGIIESSTATYPEMPERIQISGTDGTILIEGGELTQVVLRSDTANGQKVVAPESTAYQPGKFHAMQIRDFVDAIRSGRDPMVTGQDGRKVLEIVLSVYESARRDAPVSLPLMSTGVHT